MSDAVSPFAKVETQNVDFPALERQILALWDEHRIFDRLRAKNAGKPKWSFLDGPITANNPMGVHHAWGRTYKDAYNRYFAMTGRELRYQNGFDCQGLWVEVEVEKALGLRSKRDIENLVPGDPEASVAKFVQACQDRVNQFARVQTDQSIRLGYWMDWDRTDADWAKTPDERKSYFTMSEANNFAIWSFLKKCHEKKLVYRGYDVMPWCGRCGVGLSEMEMKEGYKTIEHRAVFVKFPLKGRPGENLLVWTTTPWTLTSNVGAAVNPELTYLRVELKGEVYYLAKGVFKQNRMESSGSDDDDAPAAGGAKKKRDWLDGVPHLSSIEQMFKSKAGKDGYKIVGEVKGADMLGWEYEGPFDDLPAQQSEYGFPADVAAVTKQQGWCPAVTAAGSHRVISGGKDVSESEGTGIVHSAPGCGAIDYVWGKQTGLPPVAPIGDDGCFHDGFGSLSGKNAADPATADAVFEQLKAKDRLFATERYVHRYPHCWRCKTELLYRLVDEWFIDMGPSERGVPNAERGTETPTGYSFRKEVAKVVERVTFLPESINGRARELDWLKNMGDWMISKKRYWGLALPIWVDEKDPTQFEVIGSREELQQRAVEGWAEFDGHTPHRPFVDRVKIKNPRTGNLMSRVPDVGNPWLDAGIVAFSTLPPEWRPADFITESFPGQFRNWFYALLAMSTMMNDGKVPPFKTLLGFATMRDQFGEEMHKSAGNSIEFIAASDSGYTIDYELRPDAKSDVVDKLLAVTDDTKDMAKLLKDTLVGANANPTTVPTMERAIKFAHQREVVTKERKGESYRVVRGHYAPMTADTLRWMYSRHEPAANLNFGPVTAHEVRARFHIKLWNCYAFFANYARLDGFDPTAPLVPVAERPDIDRWILSDLQGLVRTARESFEKYDVMGFCLEAERFVDDRLSNWYVRRNRDRFWSKNAELDDAGRRDKLAAYQTMYAVLRTLSQLIAPVVPFLADVMWQNLRTGNDPASVHLCDFPTPDDSLRYEALSRLMNCVMRLTTLGGAARNASKSKVRQPLAEMIVSFGSDDEFQAVNRYHAVIEDELNVRKVRNRNEGEHIGALSFRLNPKTFRGKAGKDVDKLWQCIQSILSEVAASGQLDLMHRSKLIGNSEYALSDDGLRILREKMTVALPEHSEFAQRVEAEDVLVSFKPRDGFTAAEDRATIVLIDTRITPELKAEGMARDVIRFVQDARKSAKLDVADKIELFLAADAPELAAAIAAHRTTIAAETQAVAWADAPLTGEAFTDAKKVDGHPLTISLRKV